MGRKSGYDFPASPARQGAPPPSITGSGREAQRSARQGPSSGPAINANQQVPPATSSTGSTPLPAGFVPAHVPRERRAPSEYDSAREYAAVETGRLPQQPRVPAGRFRLAHEVRQLDGPTTMPSVRAAHRYVGGGRGSSGSSAPPQLQQQQPVLSAVSSSANPPRAAASGQGIQESRQRSRAWAMAEYARRNPQRLVPSEQEIASLIRELEESAAA